MPFCLVIGAVFLFFEYSWPITGSFMNKMQRTCRFPSIKNSSRFFLSIMWIFYKFGTAFAFWHLESSTGYCDLIAVFNTIVGDKFKQTIFNNACRFLISACINRLGTMTYYCFEILDFTSFLSSFLYLFSSSISNLQSDLLKLTWIG